MTTIPPPMTSPYDPPHSPVVSGDNDQNEPVVTPASLRGDLLNVFRGYCMGAADTVPGVSGGTVALILGHYDRLIAAIGNIDVSCVGLLVSRRFAELAAKIDLRFLLALGLGIGTGIVTLAGLMHWLLLNRMNETQAVFFGLVLASVWIVRRNVTHWSPGRWVGLAVGIAIAVGISQLPTTLGEITYPFLFGSASVAICAMILPGISGAFVLLLLGVYEPVIGMIKGLLHGEISVEIFAKLAVFALGCLFGLLAFSRLLNFLLRHHRDVTMATLIGLMIGSVGRLWPLQRVTPETADLEMKYQQFQWVQPGDYPGSISVLIACAVIAAAVVFVADAVAAKK